VSTTSILLKARRLAEENSCRAHITDDTKRLVSKYSKLAIIPGGLTKKIQPLDLSVTKSFKSKL
jgi:hypothetical protein